MTNCKILLITPPFVQPNTPYPATPMLTSYLEANGISAEQRDLSIDTISTIFSKRSLAEIFALVRESEFAENYSFINSKRSIPAVQKAISGLRLQKEVLYSESVHELFLDSADQQLDPSIADGEDTLLRSQYISSQIVKRIAAMISECIDPNFGFSKYAESIVSARTSAEEFLDQLDESTYITDIYLTILDRYIEELSPEYIGFTVPFPGNLFATIQCCKHIKENHSGIKTLIGGGFCSTEFRTISDPNIFKYVDRIILDEGEEALLNIITGREEINTLYLESSEVKSTELCHTFKHRDRKAPTYRGLNMGRYIDFIDIINPMHQLWSCGRWNKMVLAYGCYWHNCSFCDTSLDYIKRYNATSVGQICDWIESVIKQTGSNGFHFTDEAAPPKLLKELSLEILKRGLKIRWWTNIRFEKSFTFELAQLLASAGCIAVSGGLEVASDRLLKLMKKGVTVDQVTKAAYNLKSNGILVHAYLMYGFPTETAQETIDSLEVVRQLFKNRIIDSGFWHRFAMTVHSPIGIEPDRFEVERVEINDGSFTLNDCDHLDPKGTDHGLFSDGLKRSLFNFMHYSCLDHPLDFWFDHKTPAPSIDSSLIESYLNESSEEEETVTKVKRYKWIGGTIKKEKEKKGSVTLKVKGKGKEFNIKLSTKESIWLIGLIKRISISDSDGVSEEDLINSYIKECNGSADDLFLSSFWSKLRSQIIIL